MLLVLAALGLTACSSGSGSSMPTTLPPRPALANFVPSSAVVTSQRSVQLAPTGPPQVAVTYISQQQSSSGFTYRDLLILSWDHYARRWVDVFDGSKVQAPGETGGPAQDNTVLPTSANVERLEDFPLASVPGRTDLVFWSFLNFGANGNLEVDIVHFDGQTASVQYFESYSPSPQGGTPSVTGKAPNEQLSIPAGWLTSDDPECCAIRGYVNTIVFRTQTLSGGYKSSTYVLTASTQPWLGVYAVIPLNPNGTTPPPNPIVVSVVPGSPAAGVLHPGDQFLGVSGETVPSASDLGPPVIDEIAKNLPGATIPLEILRGGTQTVVNIPLASTAATAYVAASAPEVGYLGVEVGTQGAQAGTPAGAFVEQVEDGSPAAASRLIAGDVITSIGSTSVTSADALTMALYLMTPGTSVMVAYVGPNSGAASTTVTLAPYPSSGVSPSVVAI